MGSNLFLLLPTVIFFVFSGLLELLEAESTMMRSVAGPARIVNFPLTLVLHIAGPPLGTESSRAAVWLVVASHSLHLHRDRGHLGVGRHGHHHVSWVHLGTYLGPGC